MFLTRLTRCAAVGMGGLALVAASATTAGADAYAPYAQAAAHVTANGTLLEAKSIDAVTRPSTGIYCLHVSDPEINFSESIFTATLGTGANRGSSVQIALGRTECGGDPRTIPVVTGDRNGSFAGQEFYLTIQ
ncbi:hypothetical protein [Streptomyces sp. NPDC059564]|uniref:hypothetical protein n=1 Tax=Streptomyces sp. NPDC059564 TaxID=3346865 RepID=UPI0036C9D8B0